MNTSRFMPVDGCYSKSSALPALVVGLMLAVFAHPIFAQHIDQCTNPTVGVGIGAVINSGNHQPVTGCGVVITVLTVDGSGTATSFTVSPISGTNNPYDGVEDTIVGIQNSSGQTLNSLPLSSPTSAIFGFDNDGLCTLNSYSWCNTNGFSGYEGPANNFSITDVNDGTANFTNTPACSSCMPIPNGGSTWFSLEGSPQSLLASQTKTLEPGVESNYMFGNDNYKITPSTNSMGGELLTITAVPVLKSSFIPPSNYPAESCIPFADYSSANGQDTCVEFQADCTGSDCNTLLYQLKESYDLPADLPAIGGPDFLVVHGSPCPISTGAIAQSIFTDYFVNRIDPTNIGKGPGTGSCFIVTYTPGAPLITSGSLSRFIGFSSPVVNDQLNLVKSGSVRPLQFQWLDNKANPVTNLSWCANTTGTGCTAPWVNLGYFAINCNTASSNGSNTATDISSPGNSGFQNLGGGNYQMNWQTQKSWKGTCSTIQVTFDNGVTLVPAVGFQFN